AVFAIHLLGDIERAFVVETRNRANLGETSELDARRQLRLLLDLDAMAAARSVGIVGIAAFGRNGLGLRCLFHLAQTVEVLVDFGNVGFVLVELLSLFSVE